MFLKYLNFGLLGKFLKIALGRKRDKRVGQWDSGKSRNRLFGNDLRTNQEAVRQYDGIIPGKY